MIKPLVRLYAFGYVLMHRLLKTDFIRFCVVGTSGFTVNLIFLTVLHNVAGIQVTVAQLISAEIALLSNFMFHYIWTFKNHHHVPLRTKIIKFHMSSWGGVIITTIIVTIGVEHFDMNYLLSLAIASAIALFWNFVWTKFFIFKSAPLSEAAAESLLHSHDEE